MKRRSFLKITGGSLLIPAIGNAGTDIIGDKLEVPVLEVTNIIPTSRIAVISYGNVIIQDTVKGTTWSCYPPIDVPLTVRIRKFITPPYYKSFEINDLYVSSEGLILTVQQLRDY